MVGDPSMMVGDPSMMVGDPSPMHKYFYTVLGLMDAQDPLLSYEHHGRHHLALSNIGYLLSPILRSDITQYCPKVLKTEPTETIIRMGQCETRATKMFRSQTIYFGLERFFFYIAKSLYWVVFAFFSFTL